jgi:hypothetical protein
MHSPEISVRVTEKAVELKGIVKIAFVCRSAYAVIRREETEEIVDGF